METIIAILMYLGFLSPGTYSLEQFNTILMTQQAQITAVQNDPLLSAQAGQTSIVGVVINDPDKDN
ncbi:MAG: hypothetical protein HYZ54_09270 [Ignavibacteriae bacterium]|nr:hypothetical protein [Ignavibacteriota bacterium]